MATLAIVPVAEYLSTMYHPDRDYIDGELRERAVGEKPHSGLQTLLSAIFWNNRRNWKLRPLTEQRVQISATRFRIPDVCAIQLPSEVGDIVLEAPVVCIEILSPGDTLTEMQERIDDYVGMGVGNIWIIDPVRRHFWTADASGVHPLRQDAFSIAGTDVSISLDEIKAELDDIAAGL